MEAHLILNGFNPAITVPSLSPNFGMLFMVAIVMMQTKPIITLQADQSETHRIEVKDIAVSNSKILTIMENVSLTECIMGCQEQYGGYCLAIGYRYIFSFENYLHSCTSYSHTAGGLQSIGHNVFLQFCVPHRFSYTLKFK